MSSRCRGWYLSAADVMVSKVMDQAEEVGADLVVVKTIKGIRCKE